MPTTPASPGAISQPQTLQLHLLDITATALAFTVLSPSLSNAQASGSGPSSREAGTSTTGGTAGKKHPLISIQLNGQPWPHVAHASPQGDEGEGSTVIVYGLSEGREYEIGVEVVGEGEEDDVEAGTGVEAERGEARDEDGDDDEEPAPPDDPPPAYTPSLNPPTSPSSTPNNPTATLRLALRTLRSSHKSTESTLLSSIAALRKAVEKGIKEDQRARSRLVGLEEGIRKAGEAEAEAREESQRIKDKSGEKGGTGASTPISNANSTPAEKEKEKEKEKDAPKEKDVPKEKEGGKEKEREKDDEGEEDDSNVVGLGELVRELEVLNRGIEEKEQERRRRVKENLRTLEVELGVIEGELIQLDRDEQHRYNLARLSTDSLNTYPYGGFNIKWRRGPAPSAANPANFTRFFTRRNVSDPTPPPPPPPPMPSDGGGTTAGLRPGTAGYRAQQLALEHQRVWAEPNAVSGPPAASSSGGGFGAKFLGVGGRVGMRRRSGSVGSSLSTGSGGKGEGMVGMSHASGSSSALSLSAVGEASEPMAIPGSGSDAGGGGKKEKEGGGSTPGKEITAWGRTTWSSIVGKGKKADKEKKEETEAEAEE
ncbi:hypothetical protein MNV49_005525 [Pseudohyphozyma bogoriensis]|nr:hypothetical protein MNV49_005525 [Pseudohyphozyma bogoriensis]